jgi:hypothetical protein
VRSYFKGRLLVRLDAATATPRAEAGC